MLLTELSRFSAAYTTTAPREPCCHMLRVQSAKADQQLSNQLYAVRFQPTL